MTPHALDQPTRRKISSLMGNAAKVASVARKATKKATTERRKLDAQAAQAREEQQARERKLDDILAQVVRGLSAIIELGRTAEIRKLAAARASIKRSTPLLAMGDDRTEVSVCFAEDAIKLHIFAEVPASGQRAGGPTDYVGCEITRQYPFASKKAIAPGWFWHLFFADLHDEWDEQEFQKEDMRYRRTDPKCFVKDFELDGFAQVDLGKIARLDDDGDESWLWRQKGIDPNWVLLRFLADCSNPANLKRHLEHALANLD
jgi:hypothetical protein